MVNESLVNSQIDDLVVPKEVRVTLEKKIFALIQRYLHPEQFCPNCDERLFFDTEDSTYNCPNYEHKAIVTPSNKTTPTIEQKGVVPPRVEKIIQQSNENMKDVPIPRTKTALGAKIKKLVADRDRGGGGDPTKEDEGKIKSFGFESGKYGFIKGLQADVFYHRKSFYGNQEDIIPGRRVQFVLHAGDPADRARPVLPWTED